MKKKIIAFCPADQNNLKYYEMMKNSLRKFHSEEELPLLLIDDQKIASYKDPQFFYRATPLIARELIKEYETVVKLDADQIITGNLSEAFMGDFDVAVVNNSNPREMQTYPVSVLNIHPLAYVNAGFVVMKSESFVTFWDNFCHSILYNGLQMREQDLLNIMAFSNNYKVKKLDEGDSFWGLASKQYWQDIILEGEKLMLPKSEEWPDKRKEIKILHWAGGNSPDKMNFRIRCTAEVVKRLEALIKP